jgi:hypothetical protein
MTAFENYKDSFAITLRVTKICKIAGGIITQPLILSSSVMDSTTRDKKTT